MVAEEVKEAMVAKEVKDPIVAKEVKEPMAVIKKVEEPIVAKEVIDFRNWLKQATNSLVFFQVTQQGKAAKSKLNLPKQTKDATTASTSKNPKTKGKENILLGAETLIQHECCTVNS
ncbi:hypothetical protein IFM89_018090 [Coptis chinensis]|uniref:Uncharacterized protein n=1 Tax=Coptis chinensis TaxID=261450 RepID=A0A835IDD8_9MAGN|nr:hypothetical protein IFM89_018090 [Coptis chinensis]